MELDLAAMASNLKAYGTLSVHGRELYLSCTNSQLTDVIIEGEGIAFSGPFSWRGLTTVHKNLVRYLLNQVFAPYLHLILPIPIYT